MRAALVWLINAACRPIDAWLTRQQNRLNGDDDEHRRADPRPQ